MLVAPTRFAWTLLATFLPPGQGGLILIMGGVAMLGFALLVLMASAPRVVARPTLSPTMQSPTVGQAAARYKWPLYVQQQVRRRGLDGARLLAVAPSSCTIATSHCRSCRGGRRGCNRERKAIQKAARSITKRAHVEEAVCGQGQGDCIFQVDMGGAA